MRWTGSFHYPEPILQHRNSFILKKDWKVLGKGKVWDKQTIVGLLIDVSCLIGLDSTRRETSVLMKYFINFHLLIFYLFSSSTNSEIAAMASGSRDLILLAIWCWKKYLNFGFS